MTRKTLSIFAVVCMVALMMSTTAFSAPIVSYGVSGSSGNWNLDFSVTNTLGVNNMDIYFFGVALDPINQGSPTNWGTYNNFNPSYSWGGPNLNFGTGWLDFGTSIPDMIQNGETLSGFDVTVNTLDAPTSVQWYAFAYDWTGGGAQYLGNDHFWISTNPGFAGVAQGANSVPEPATFLLFGTGLAGFGLLRKRFKS